MAHLCIQLAVTLMLISPPRKLRSKNPKVALNLWQKLRKKVALKLRAIWLIFGCKMLLWPFGTLPNFGTNNKTTSVDII